MQIIRYVRFQTAHSGQFYMVGADIDKMRASAKQFDASSDAGTEVDSERVLEIAKAKDMLQTFENAVRLAKGGHSDYYLFST